MMQFSNQQWEYILTSHDMIGLWLKDCCNMYIYIITDDIQNIIPPANTIMAY